MTVAPIVIGVEAEAPCGCLVSFAWPSDAGERTATLAGECLHRPWSLSLAISPGRWPSAGRQPYALREGRLPASCWCGRHTLSVPVQTVRAGLTGSCSRGCRRRDLESLL